ncbi:MAG TPA: phenylalanine--tRNA ligase subunit beta [Syntrophomonadaceae bacterium]|nr:phenylalanine--tRNA ligase subunit beta [Syntrophomonadaceae bacterium]
MNVSLNWLKNYVDINIDEEELAHKLTMAGVAVEGIEKVDTDHVLELDLTPNRGDCLGLINIAREISAITGSQLKIPDIKIKENHENINDYIDIEIADQNLCKRYAARLVKNVQIKPSPTWLQEALTNSGIRPVNNVVDVSNYVMLETNQPLHTFDYDLLGSKKILVRRALEQEEILTLDESKRKLDGDMLVITNGEKPVAVAGVMGGYNSEINDNTVNVLIESANFSATSVRKTSQKLGLRSDSSIRFEKGVDVNGTIFAVNRAAQLIQKLAEGEVVAGILDVYPQPITNHTIFLRAEKVNDLLGTNLSIGEMEEYLLSLDFKIEKEKNKLIVEIPTYRPDLEIEVDLIEEIARLHGYDNIAATLPEGVTTQGGLDDYQLFRKKTSTLLAKNMLEVINYSFINNNMLDKLLIPGDSHLRQVVKVANPLSEEQGVMRTLLLPSLLTNIAQNLARRNENLSFFELGSVFIPREGDLPTERLKLGAIVSGSSEVNWLKHKIDYDFFYLKGILENFLDGIGLKEYEFMTFSNPSYHPGRTAKLLIKDIEVGVLGEIHPTVLDNFDIKQAVCAFELDLDTLYELMEDKMGLETITKYPAVERDIAIVVHNDITAKQILNKIKKNGTEILQDVIVFDLYTGEQVPDEHKSLALKLKFQAFNKTLTENEVNQVVDNILNKLNELGAKLR